MSVGRTALRLVLFGMPDAGKSSLLGALAQAAQTQQPILNGNITEEGHGLAELRQRVYEGAPRQTLEELVPFPIVVESLAKSSEDAVGREVTIFDCDGKAANDLLSGRRPLDAAHVDGSLAHAVLDADTLILVVDGAVSPAQLESDFAEFSRFLHLLQHSRGQRTDVGGLPVFLVLTKSDLLAQADDDLAAWTARINDHKRQVGQRFQEFLAHHKAEGPLPFGRIDLHLAATAIKRPALQNEPSRPLEPWGVAELFRQGFDSARAFRARRTRSGRRLLWTSAGTFAAVAFFALLAVVLFASRPGERLNLLELQVDGFRARYLDQSPAERHQDVSAKLTELSRLADDPAFPDLPPEKQAYVQEVRKELTSYQEFQRQLDNITDPREARTASQLQSIKERLSQVTMAPEYQVEWEQTEASRRLYEWLKDVDAIAEADASTRAAYEKLVREGQQVLDRKNEPNLPKRAKAVLAQAQALPNPHADRDKLIPGSHRVTYATVFDFPAVDEWVRRWEDDVKRKLEPFARLEQT